MSLSVQPAPRVDLVDAALDVAEGLQDNNSVSTPPLTIEQRLQLSYMLPGGEAVTSPAITTTADAAAADSADSNDTQTLKWSSTHSLNVTDTVVHDMASSNAALAVTIIAASRSIAKTAEPAAAAAPPVAGKPAKPGKAGTVLEEAPWQADQQHIAAIDLAPLLVGDTDVVCTWPKKGLAMPSQLQAYSSMRIHLQVWYRQAQLQDIYALN